MSVDARPRPRSADPCMRRPNSLSGSQSNMTMSPLGFGWSPGSKNRSSFGNSNNHINNNNNNNNNNNGLRMSGNSIYSHGGSKNIAHVPLPNQHVFDRLHEDAVVQRCKIEVKRAQYEQERAEALKNSSMLAKQNSPRSPEASPLSSSDSWNNKPSDFCSSSLSPRSSPQQPRYRTKDELFKSLHESKTKGKYSEKFQNRRNQFEQERSKDLRFEPKLHAPKSAQLAQKFRSEHANQIKYHLNIDVEEVASSPARRSPPTNLSANSTPRLRGSDLQRLAQGMSLREFDTAEQSPEEFENFSPMMAKDSSSAQPGNEASEYWNIINQFADVKPRTADGLEIDVSNGNANEMNGPTDAPYSDISQKNNMNVSINMNSSYRSVSLGGSQGGSPGYPVQSELDVSYQEQVRKSRVGGVIVSKAATFQRSMADEYFNNALSEKKRREQAAEAELNKSSFARSNRHSIGNASQNIAVTANAAFMKSPAASPLASSIGSTVFTYRPIGSPRSPRPSGNEMLEAHI